MAAGAGVHCGDQLEMRGEYRLAGGSRDMDAPGFERFAQGFEDLTLEFRQLIEKEDAFVGERDFAGPRHAAAADQCDGRGRMVR